MRIVVISDIHSNLEALQTVIENLPRYDCLLFLGDLVGYGPQPNEVIERLQEMRPAAVIMGNHDYSVATGDTRGFSTLARVVVEWTRRQLKPQNLDYLCSLPPTVNIELNKTRVALFHGSPRNSFTEYIFPGISVELARQLIHKASAPLVLVGHTHMPMLCAFDGKMLANPGSVGQPRDGDPNASFAILNLLNDRFSFEVKRVEYDIDAVAGRIVHAGLPRFLADRLYTGM